MCLSEKDYSRKYRNKQEENFAVSGSFQIPVQDYDLLSLFSSVLVFDRLFLGFGSNSSDLVRIFFVSCDSIMRCIMFSISVESFSPIDADAPLAKRATNSFMTASGEFS